MPPHGNGVDSKEARDGGHREPLEFVHHDDSSATWRQVVECPPHRRPDQKRPFRVIVLAWRAPQVELVALANRFLAPLISSNVNEYADQPCLFIPQSARNGFGRPRSLEERFLNKVQGIIGTRDETSGEAVQPVCMRLEQSGQSVSLLRRHSREDARNRPLVHTSLNA